MGLDISSEVKTGPKTVTSYGFRAGSYSWTGEMSRVPGARKMFPSVDGNYHGVVAEQIRQAARNFLRKYGKKMSDFSPIVTKQLGEPYKTDKGITVKWLTWYYPYKKNDDTALRGALITAYLILKLPGKNINYH